jgi:hypothetical protein
MAMEHLSEERIGPTPGRKRSNTRIITGFRKHVDNQKIKCIHHSSVTMKDLLKWGWLMALGDEKRMVDHGEVPVLHSSHQEMALAGSSFDATKTKNVGEPLADESQFLKASAGPVQPMDADRPEHKALNWEHLSDLGPLVPHVRHVTWSHTVRGMLKSAIQYMDGYHKRAKEIAALLALGKAEANLKKLWDGQGDPLFIIQLAHHQKFGVIGCTFEQVEHLHNRRFSDWLQSKPGYGLSVVDNPANQNLAAKATYLDAKEHRFWGSIQPRWQKVWEALIADAAKVLVDGYATKEEYCEDAPQNMEIRKDGTRRLKQRVRLANRNSKVGDVQVVLDCAWEFDSAEPNDKAFREKLLREAGLMGTSSKESRVAWIVTTLWLYPNRADTSVKQQGLKEFGVVASPGNQITGPIPRYPEEIIGVLEAQRNDPK